MDHEAETTRYNELVKGHIDTQKKLLKTKRKAKENSEQLPPKKTVIKTIVEEQPQGKAPETSVHEELIRVKRVYNF